VPFSPILMTVSHELPSPSLVPLVCSLFLVNRMILPDGVCTASFAGFVEVLPDELDDDCDGFV
jgi:hypothetical protein